jgi:hypothetical protein
MEQTSKKANTSILVYGVIWVATYLVCLLAVKRLEPAVWLGILLSLVPVITFGTFIYHYIKAMSSLDEVGRRIQLEATIWGFSLGLLLLMTLGSLELVLKLDPYFWGYRSLIPYFVFFYCVGLFISNRKYK